MNVKIWKAAFPVVITLALMMAVFNLTSVVVHYKPLPSHASVKAVGVGAFWDVDCINEVTEVDWGLIEPGGNVTVTLYLLGTGNSPVTLSMWTESWEPPNAGDYISLTWTLEGSTLDPDQVLPAELTLHCSPDVTGITDFSFVIVVAGTG